MQSTVLQLLILKTQMFIFYPFICTHLLMITSIIHISPLPPLPLRFAHKLTLTLTFILIHKGVTLRKVVCTDETVGLCVCIMSMADEIFHGAPELERWWNQKNKMVDCNIHGDLFSFILFLTKSSMRIEYHILILKLSTILSQTKAKQLLLVYTVREAHDSTVLILCMFYSNIFYSRAELKEDWARPKCDNARQFLVPKWSLKTGMTVLSPQLDHFYTLTTFSQTAGGYLHDSIIV